MSYLRMSDVKAAAEAYQGRQFVRKSASQILSDQARDYSSVKTYDVFLSHSRQDAEIILGVKAILEANKLVVYVDWVDDPQLDRGNVTAETAAVLRKRMSCCKQFVFATSENSSTSKWMPWELGYFDGLKSGGVSILPIVKAYDEEFKGQEYLKLYPVLEKVTHLGNTTAVGLIEGRSHAVKGDFIWLTDMVRGVPQRYPLQ
ncbi:MAG: TIR domain-containing protein [Bryobacteraceae bacterium]|nr:TIR domain-containing protein [Bryobacteraceae bacterium]